MTENMKNTFKYIALGIAFLASTFALNAQGTYHREGGMATSKTVTGPVGGYYTITLESFATGETTVTETGIPVDIVLVLDVSGSMEDILYTYNGTTQEWTYNNVGNTNRYYKHTDGNYYQVNRTGNGNSRRLYFQIGSGYNVQTWYLWGSGAQQQQPTGVGQYTTIFNGTLYTRASRGTKISNLKSAVNTFIGIVNDNALHNSDGSDRTTPLTNQISIVKYAADRYCNANGNSMGTPYDYDGQYADNVTPGNHRGAKNNNNYNYTEVLAAFTDVSTAAGVSSLTQAVTSINEGGATAADFGLYKATYLLEQVKNRESTKVVVMFTDGEPNHSSGFDDDVADDAIGIAKTIKSTYGATVFSVGVFDSISEDLEKYMHYVSSDYPNAQDLDTPGSGGSDSKGYYQNASGSDLTEIFKDIAHAAAAADATAGASTQVRDVVSNSFILPSGDAAGITIKVADISSDGLRWEDAVPATGVSYEIKTVTTSTGEEHQELMVTGFDYTKADVVDPNDEFNIITLGNWVGERYSDKTTKYWAGKKLIIEFKVQANGEATGGDGTATNHPDSGVYVQEFNEDGSPKLDGDGNPIYKRVNQYDVPHTPLPVLIKIQKDGLRTGESATFQLFRARPKGWNDEGETLEEKMANVEYNAIGKPLPDLHDFDSQSGKLDQNDPMDYLEGIGWDDWSKVILTNKGADNAGVLKTLYGLDPGWVYMVVEDDWGWAYELTGESTRETTSDSELNPFMFHNRARTVNAAGDPIVKHAEAVTINHFQTKDGSEGAREEHYKSSKTIFKSTKN